MSWVDEVFVGLEEEVARNLSMCEAVLCKLESGSGLSDDEILDLPTEKFKDNAPRCQDNAPRCHDNAPRCQDNASRCQDNASRCQDNAPRCHDNAPRCHDNASRCHDNAPRCHDNAPRCHDNASRCQDNASRCQDNAPRCHDNAPRCHDNAPCSASPPKERKLSTCNNDLRKDSITCANTCADSSVDNSADNELRTSFHIWYQPDLSRELTEEMLVKQPLGTFYIRGSSKVNHYALSVHISHTSPRVEHYLVHDKGDVLQMENSSQEFPNFVKLLAFFAQSKTYSATTGIPVQLKIPRLISTSGRNASVYDQIELTPREHGQASPQSDDQSSCGHMKDPMKCDAAPPKPPKPKNYRGNNFNCPHEKDLIYINLDKSPDKMINVAQNDLSSRNDLSTVTPANSVLRLNKKQGRAVFYAPPPPTEDDSTRPVFIAPSPPLSPPPSPPHQVESSDGELASCTGSLYSSKNSVESVRLRTTRSGRPTSVMEKVRSRVFKMDRASRRSVRAKLCQKLSPQILRLTDCQDFTYSSRVTTFVTYVRQRHERHPERLMTLIREFMCSIKHDLINNCSDAIEEMVGRAQKKIGPPPKLNDLIEGVLVKAVIWPLRGHIAKVLEDQDSLEAEKLRTSMAIALSKSLVELGIEEELLCGQDIDWSVPVQCLQDIPNHYSPIKKLERLLAAVNAIYNTVREVNLEQKGVPCAMGADQFLPLFIYVLALSRLHSAGQEMLQMQCLLDPPLLIGEPGYYLTTLASSILLLKSLDFNKSCLPAVGHLQSMLQIHFTDADMKEIAYKTVPVNQNTNTRDILLSLATKFRLDGIEGYGLYKVEDNTETLLGADECPQLIKNEWLVESLERDISAYFTFHRLR